MFNLFLPNFVGYILINCRYIEIVMKQINQSINNAAILAYKKRTKATNGKKNCQFKTDIMIE